MVRYRLRSGWYTSEAKAKKRVKKLKKANIDSYYFKKGTHYFVQVGYYENKKYAKAYQKQLLLKGFGSKIIKENIMAFSPRLTRTGMQGSEYWYSSGNPFTASGNGLPNCTCYTYGRWWEILGSNPTDLPRGNAGTWYNKATSFSRGSTPQLGAIACWYDPSGLRAGHVAVVEKIESNGDIVTSNSGYTRDTSEIDRLYFWTETCPVSTGYRSSWEVSYGYVLAGFIYLNGTPQSKAWIYGNRYLTQTEMENNAECAYDYLINLGYSPNAIFAILGNAQQESGVNPAIWENLVVNPSRGYGLFQFTPSTYYTDWATQNGYSITDGYAQLHWVDTEMVPFGAWVPTGIYNLSFQEFKTNGAQTIEYLTSCWYYEFEKPGPSDTTLQTRINYALAWKDYFDGYIPSDPVNPPIQDIRTGLKIWQMIRYAW